MGRQLGKPNRFSRNKEHFKAGGGITASEDNDKASARADEDSDTEMRGELNRQHIEAGGARSASEDQESEAARGDGDSDMRMQGKLGRQLGKPNRFSRGKQHVESGGVRTASENEGSASARGMTIQIQRCEGNRTCNLANPAGSLETSSRLILAEQHPETKNQCQPGPLIQGRKANWASNVAHRIGSLVTSKMLRQVVAE